MYRLSNTLLLTVVTLIGLCYLVLVPPFQVPDEQNHFYRSYQISEGMLFSRKIGQLRPGGIHHTGGDLPKALSQLNNQFNTISFEPNKHLTQDNFSLAWQIKIDPHDRKKYTFSNTALFSFVCYLAPATGIQIASYFSDRALVKFYAARVFCLLMSIFSLWLACTIYSPAKLFYFFVTLLPMNIHQLVAISSDAFTNSVVLIFIASVLKLFCQKPASWYRQATCVAFTMLLACAKQIATPILGIMIFAKVRNFRSRGHYLFFMCCFYLISVLVIGYWVMKAQEIYNPLYWHANTNAQEQFLYVRENTIDVFTMFMAVLREDGLKYLQTGIGSQLGYRDTFPPEWVIIAFKVMAVLLILLHPRLSDISLQQALGFFCICILGIFVVKLALYLNTSPIGANSNKYVHGRYFIAYFLLALIALGQLIPKSKVFTQRFYPVLAIGTVMAMVISSAVVLWSVVLRYFF